MRILMINVVCGVKSTGRICTDLAAALEARGHEVKIAYGRESVPEEAARFAVRIGTDWDVKLHGLRARALDASGWGSKTATERFLRRVREFDPDVIHLHNIHGYYINVELLFGYLKTCGKPILWTLHDCWAFTGHAAYCEAANCRRWTQGCHDCPKRSDYPASFTDRSRSNWRKKRALFTGVPRMSLITPSAWLAALVGRSFLSEYPVEVIPNGIDTTAFRPLESEALRERLDLRGKKVVLGVAARWDERKGLADLLSLRERLDESYALVLVGLSEEQLRRLPAGMVGLRRTDSLRELAELYSMAAVFVNPTYEDNYPTTNIEAIACGTPVVSYDTGGSGESARLYGAAVPKGDLEALTAAVVEAANTPKDPFGAVETLDKDRALGQYLALYDPAAGERERL